MSLGVEIDFHAELALRDKRIAALQQQMNRARAAVPRDSRLQFSPINTPTSAYPAAGNLILFLDGPQQGKAWDVRQIIVGGIAANSAPAGTAYVFSCTASPLDLGLANAKDVSMTPFPVKGFYGTAQFRVQPPNNLYVVITGGTPGTYYSAVADVQEYDLTLLQQTVFEV